MGNVRISAVRRSAVRASVARIAVPNDTGRSLGLRGGTTFDNVTIPSLTLGNSFSFGLWFKMLNTASFQRLVSWRTSGAGGFELEENGTTNKLTFIGSNASGTAVINLAPTATFSLGTWTHVAVTYAANNTVMYLNGVSIATDATHALAPATGQILTLGKASFTNGTTFIGLIDQFVLANNTVWSGAEVAALYNNGTAPTSAQCILNFDEPNGPVALDSSGNGNVGSVNASSTAYNRFSDIPPHQPTYNRPNMYP